MHAHHAHTRTQDTDFKEQRYRTSSKLNNIMMKNTKKEDVIHKYGSNIQHVTGFEDIFELVYKDIKQLTAMLKLRLCLHSNVLLFRFVSHCFQSLFSNSSACRQQRFENNLVQETPGTL